MFIHAVMNHTDLLKVTVPNFVIKCMTSHAIKFTGVSKARA